MSIIKQLLMLVMFSRLMALKTKLAEQQKHLKELSDHMSVQHPRPQAGEPGIYSMLIGFIVTRCPKNREARRIRTNLV